ncbi:MAG: nuclear transport factor 2 family protein, partial [Chloroflexi bacterium]|nr:nuclear transport factor 2 family protein [Chloroflexota bacterium]
RFEDGRLAEYWVAKRQPGAEPWPTASAETLTVDEEANLETLTRWADLYQNRSDDFEAVADLVTDPYVTHGARGTSSERREEIVPFLVEFRELSPGYEGQFDDVFIVGDLAARRLSYRYPEPLPGRGSLQCGIAIYRFEDHRVAEYWNIYLPIDVGWD